MTRMAMARPDNPRFPHTCRITRQVDSIDPMAGKQPAVVIYEGVCRGYNRDTITDNGDVNASHRYLSLPVKQDEWTEETIPQEGDRIELQKFGYVEYGEVTDRRPGNLGTHLLWKYVRN